MSDILIVEDQADLRSALQGNLEFEGYRVEATGSGVDALELLRERSPRLLVLDLMLPDLDGMRLLRSARADGYRGAVLVLSARGEEIDKVHALAVGADDYVTKPFGLLELLARIAALLRRFDASTAADNRCFADVELDAQTHEVRRGGAVVALTPKEYDLLLCLARAQGAVMSRRELLATVWGHAGAVATRTVDTHIAELRRKLERDPARPSHLLTVRKVGYRLRSEY